MTRRVQASAVAVAGLVTGLTIAHGAELVARATADPTPAVRVAHQRVEPTWRVSRASAYNRSDSPGRMACTGGRVPWDQPVVAHKTLPCGTRLEVCAGPRCVTVRVADRGPYIRGRDLDLTPGVYRSLGARSAPVWGVRRVTWRVIPRGGV